MPVFDKKNPFMPHIAGTWDLCPDCAPFDVPICGDCKKVEGAWGGQFVHTAPFDGKGVLHWIGTAGGTKTYANPHGKPGGVVAKTSYSRGEPSRFVDHAQVGEWNNTDEIRNSWMSVDLGNGRQLVPDYYCLRHGQDRDYAVPRNWVLEGSNDGTTWTILNTHGHDKSLALQAYSTASWPIQAQAAAAGTPYRYFRIFATGKNSTGFYQLSCAGIELYGLLTEDSAVMEARAAAAAVAAAMPAPFDTKGGVLHWIGTAGGTKAYANPHGKPGGVVAKTSSEYGSDGGPSRFVDHAQVGVYNWTKNSPNSSMSVDLGEGRQLAPDYYCLRNGGVGEHCGRDIALRNWQLEGSNDGTTWTILKTHANDAALAGAFGTASWPIQAPAAAARTLYRHFRILQTGKNAVGQDHLSCAGIELYGPLTE